jgi:hypothetical protein
MVIFSNASGYIRIYFQANIQATACYNIQSKKMLYLQRIATKPIWAAKITGLRTKTGKHFFC